MNKLIIIGAGGHGKVIADIALKNGYKDISFLDDCSKGNCVGFPIIGACTEMEVWNDGHTDFVIGVGNNASRRKISAMHDVNWATLIHPSAQIGVNVSIGKGTVVMAGAVINSCATIGDHCIINTSSVIEHDNIIRNYVHISPRAALGGTVCIGDSTHVGIGAVVKNNVDICNDCVIGAGAVVIKDI